jgi:RecQ family ATP-dependent DNA helicase
MKTTFGITSLRSLQPRAIQGALRGESLVVVMATGSGKSLCYQLPAAVLPGLTIVVSPLIALMVDQVQSLNVKGIEAAYLSSLDTARTRNDVLHRLTGIVPDTLKKKRSSGITKAYNEDQAHSEEQRPDIKLLYCTPELIATQHFQTILQRLYNDRRLSMIAIDEAHCISTWGHDFRPSYLKLAWLRSAFNNVPVMACTATATPKVIQDIREVLSISNNDACLLSSFNRPNISYEVRDKYAMGEKEALNDLVGFIKCEHTQARLHGYPCSGIVYVHKRDDTSFIAKAIADAGISAEPYHAGLKDGKRQQVQDDWTKGSIKVTVATIAFGMGIDLPHVRYVIHWSLSKTVEGFYQESGRAGRDLRPAKSILYYSQHDASRMIFLCDRESENTKVSSNSKDKQVQAIQKVVEYCTTQLCRRKFLLQYFGEKMDPKTVCNKTCDNCIHPDGSKNRTHVTVNHGISNRPNIQKDDWDGQWARPHGECSEYDEEDKRAADDIKYFPKARRKSPKQINEMLSHYEVSPISYSFMPGLCSG